mgnify:CR=1 FL=1
MGLKIRLLGKRLRSKAIPEQSKREAKTAVQTKLHWNKSNSTGKKATIPETKVTVPKVKAAPETKNTRQLAEQKGRRLEFSRLPTNYYFPLR